MKKIIIYPIIGLLAIAFLVACRHEVPLAATTGIDSTGSGTGNGGNGSSSSCDPNVVYFNQQVLPIFISNCTMSGCHDAASSQDGVILTSYANVMNTADVRAGLAYQSKVYKVLLETDLRKRMPYQRAPLSQTQIDLIRKWIDQGAKDLSCQNICDTTNVTFSGSIRPIITTKCVGCHSGSAPAGGFDYSIYTGVKAKVSDGRLWGAINQLPGFSPMPKNGAKLSDCEIAQFKKWIDAGAPNN